MSTFKRFEEMEVWQKSIDLTTQIYHETSLGQFSKDYILTNQVRKAAISIASNIAEGFERDGNKEFLNFLHIAKGSCGELRCQLIIAARLMYMDTIRFQELNDQSLEIIRSLNKLIKYLKETELKGRKYK